MTDDASRNLSASDTPIVRDVRAIRDALIAEHGSDVDSYFARLRAIEARLRAQGVRFVKTPAQPDRRAAG